MLGVHGRRYGNTLLSCLVLQSLLNCLESVQVIKLKYHIKKRPTCPSCRAKLELPKCLKNIPIHRLIQSIPLDCPYKLNGCNATPPRSELEKHKELCSFHPEKVSKQKQKRIEDLKAEKLELQVLIGLKF